MTVARSAAGGMTSGAPDPDVLLRRRLHADRGATGDLSPWSGPRPPTN